MSLSENRVTNNAAVNHHHIPYQHAICGFRHTHMQDYLVAPQVFSSFCRNDAQGASEFEKQTPALATCGHGDPLSKPYLIIYIYTHVYIEVKTMVPLAITPKSLVVTELFFSTIHVDIKCFEPSPAMKSVGSPYPKGN